MGGPVRLSIGATFAGDFEVKRVLAEGDARSVYEVEQSSTGKRLALKVLSPELVPDREAFTAEVRLGGKVETPHLVDVRSAGVDAATGFPFVVMELLDGEDLDKRLSREDPSKPMSDWDEVLSQILHGLAAVHGAGVSHGALSPETVFLAVPGIGGEPFRVELLDLGVPRPVRDADRGSRHLYLAPEQHRGDPPTARADVFTVGLLVFRMVTGRSYFSGSREEVQRAASAATLPSASSRAKELGSKVTPSAAFDAWFARCVTPAPGDRWADASEALEGAAEMLGEVSEVSAADIEDAPIEPRRRTAPPPLPPMVQRIAENPKPAIIAILVLVALALGGGFGVGAILRPEKAKSAKAKAIAWERGTKEAAEAACQKGDGAACHGLGMMFEMGVKGARDEKRAAELFLKACDGGDPSACSTLAGKLLSGDGVPEDKKRAAELHKRACDGGEAVSCADLAEMYQNGAGVPKDDGRAKALLEKACAGGYTEVCKQLAKRCSAPTRGRHATSFRRLSSAKTSTSRAASRPSAARTRGSRALRKTLVALSCAIVDGMLGAPLARSAATSAARADVAALSGSMARQKRRFAAVYSCPG